MARRLGPGLREISRGSFFKKLPVSTELELAKWFHEPGAGFVVMAREMRGCPFR